MKDPCTACFDKPLAVIDVRVESGAYYCCRCNRVVGATTTQFIGPGEMDSPKFKGALSMLREASAREDRSPINPDVQNGTVRVTARGQGLDLCCDVSWEDWQRTVTAMFDMRTAKP